MIHFVVAGMLLLAPLSPPPGGYTSCEQAAQDGQSNIPKGSPGYQSSLDRDHDGVACETDS